MAVLCFVPFTHYDLMIVFQFIQTLPGRTDSLRLLLRKVRAPSQTCRHESILLENALSFGQLPFACVCAGLGSSQWLGFRSGFQVVMWVFLKGKVKIFVTKHSFFFFLHFLAEFMFGIVIFFDCFIAVISRR